MGALNIRAPLCFMRGVFGGSRSSSEPAIILDRRRDGRGALRSHGL